MKKPGNKKQPQQPRPAGQVCPICGGDGQPVGHHGGVLLRECCDTLLSWCWVSEAAYEAWYRDPAGDYHGASRQLLALAPFWARDSEYLRAAHQRLELLRTLYPGRRKRLCDLGAGTGAFVQVARHLGYDAHGLEPSLYMVQEARRRGRNLALGGWEGLCGRWDILTMHDVLEHLTRPREALLACREALQPGGVLVVEMPLWKTPESEARGLLWRHVKPREHLCLYAEDAARALFHLAGFRVETVHFPLRGTLGKAAYYLGKQ